MTKSTLDRVAIERFLEAREWKRSERFDNSEPIRYVSKSGDWAVEFGEEVIEVCRFDDSDREHTDARGFNYTAATPRWVPEGDECYNLAELERELVSLGAMEFECPYCGESGGDLILEDSREWQGDAAHGGYVNWEETRCTNCVRTSGPQFDTCEERDGEV